MRLVWTLIFAAMTLALLAAPAAAQADRDCADFGSQAEAQAWFESHDDGLDGDDDGEACEDFDYAAEGSPEGSDAPTRVDAGAGGIATATPRQGVAGWATLVLAAATALAYAAYRQVLHMSRATD
jgi:hypothetical protein